MNFWRGVFSDNGQPSFSRIFTGILVAASIVWVSMIVWRDHKLPDFGGLIAFVPVLYFINVGGNVGKSISGNGNGGQH